jgi:hypothetical protein
MSAMPSRKAGRQTSQSCPPSSTPQRDGADEWDEANLYLAVAPTGTPWVTGLTFGSADGKSNSGAGDVFLGPLPVIDHHAQM